MLRGYIDKVSALEIAGWIADDKRKGDPVEIVVFINGTETIRCIAELYREDILPVVGSAYHGFQFGLYDFLQKGRNDIDIRVDGVEWAFEGFPTQIIKGSGEEYVELGEQGWLFLKNDSNAVNNMVSGKKIVSKENILAIRRSYIFRKLFSEYCGARFLQVIVPEKNFICNDFKASPLDLSDERPAVQIYRDMSSHGEKNILYPFDTFSSLEDREKYFYKTDTHLSHFGRLVLFEIVLDWLCLEPTFRTVSRTIEFSGDLGVKLSPPQKEIIEAIEPLYGSIIFLDYVSSKILSGGHLTGGWAYNNSGHPKRNRVLIYGTSTAFYMREFFYSQFREVFFIWGMSLDFDLIKEFHPDFVVGILSERCLGLPPRDLDDKVDVHDILQKIELALREICPKSEFQTF